MSQAYVLTGHLEGSSYLALDEPLPLSHGKVRVTVQPISEAPPKAGADVLAQIWAGNAKAGHTPPSKEEVDSDLDQERDSWD